MRKSLCRELYIQTILVSPSLPYGSKICCHPCRVIYIYQSAKLTTGPMPQASRFDAGPVALSCPLARLASYYLD